MKFKSKLKVFIHENAENIVWEMAAILSSGDELICACFHSRMQENNAVEFAKPIAKFAKKIYMIHQHYCLLYI